MVTLARKAILVVVALLNSVAFAQNTRSAVSITGVDTAACTVPDPCRTFGIALSKTNPGGEIVALSSGGYGAFVVDKTVSVIAPPAIHAAIAPATGSAITVSAGTLDRVVLRNLYLNSQGAAIGIDFNTGLALHVEGCVVNGFNGTPSSYGIDFQPSSVSSFGAHLNVIDSVLRQNSEAIRVLGPTAGARATLDNVRLDDNYIGVRTTSAHTTVRNTMCSGSPGGVGFYAVGLGNMMIENSVVTNNDIGYYSVGGSKMTLSRCAATSNNYGVEAYQSTSEIWVSDSTIAGNGQGVISTTSGVVYTRGNNTLKLNTTDIVGGFTSFSAN